MKNVFKLSAIASALILTGCGGSNNNADVDTGPEYRTIQVGFSTDVSEGDMVTPNGYLGKSAAPSLMLDDAAPEMKAIVVDALDYAKKDGYHVYVNGQRMTAEQVPGLEDNDTLDLTKAGNKLTMQVKDGYKIIIAHPDLATQLAADYSKGYSLYGEHVMTLNEGDVEIDVTNTAFSFVTLEDSPVIASVDLNTANFLASDDEEYSYGFVTGDTYQLDINAYGANGVVTYINKAEVGKHYHWKLTDLGGGLNPDWDWSEGDIGDTEVPFKASFMNMMRTVDGQWIGTVQDFDYNGLKQVPQVFMQEVPGTSIAELKLNIAVNSINNGERVPSDWGYTNLYLQDEFGTLYCASIEDGKVRLQQDWGCGHNSATLVGEWDTYSDFRRSEYNHLVLREEGDFGTNANIFHRNAQGIVGEHVSVVFECEITDPVGPVSVVKTVRADSDIKVDGNNYSLNKAGTSRRSVRLELDGTYTIGDIDVPMELVSHANHSVYVNVYVVDNGVVDPISMKTDRVDWHLTGTYAQTWEEFKADHADRELSRFNDGFYRYGHLILRPGDASNVEDYSFAIENFDVTVIK